MGLSIERFQPGGHLLVGRKIFKRHLPVAAGEKHAGEGVVVFVGDGVKLVVVAARAAEREPEECLAECVEPIVGAVSLVLSQIGGRLHLFTEIPKAGAHHRFIRAGCRIDPRGGQEVAGNLLAHKLVVGKIGIEGPHDPIAILPGIGERVVDVVAAGLAEAGHIEPVPGKALAILR